MTTSLNCFDWKCRKNGGLSLNNDVFVLKNGPIILQFEVFSLFNLFRASFTQHTDPPTNEQYVCRCYLLCIYMPAFD